jgi:hypothetical protein
MLSNPSTAKITWLYPNCVSLRGLREGFCVCEASDKRHEAPPGCTHYKSHKARGHCWQYVDKTILPLGCLHVYEESTQATLGERGSLKICSRGHHPSLETRKWEKLKICIGSCMVVRKKLLHSSQYTGRRRVGFPAGASYFFLLHSDQTGSGAHPTPNQWAWELFPPG